MGKTALLIKTLKMLLVEEGEVFVHGSLKITAAFLVGIEYLGCCGLCGREVWGWMTRHGLCVDCVELWTV